MTIYVRESMENAGNWEKAFARTLFRDLRTHLRVAGKASLRPLQMRTIGQRAVHTSKFGRSWKFKSPSKWKLVIYNRARNSKNKYHYGVTIEGGRRPGARMPPPSHLERWVQDKIPQLVAQYGVKGAAYIIARSIKRRGILPRPIMTAPKMQRQMSRLVSRQMSLMWDRAAERARLAPKPRVRRGA